jgi:DNA polymerase I
MKLVIDIETNALENPSKIWVIVCKDIDTKELFVFSNVTEDEKEKERFYELANRVDLWIGHNWLGFDYPVLVRLLDLQIRDVCDRSLDTLILSKLIDYPRDGHAIEDYGVEFELEKGKFSDWSKYSKEMEDYCARDVEICEKIYLKYLCYISEPSHRDSILLEHRFQLIANSLHNNGFGFDVDKANKLLDKVSTGLANLDEQILTIPPHLKPVREVHPVRTKYGTLHKKDFRWIKDGDLSDFTGDPFTRCVWVNFNPASHKHLINLLHSANWKPLDKTQAHIDACKNKSVTDHHLKYGWKVNEVNLGTLPKSAPTSVKLLSKRILLESRRRTLVEWMDLVKEDGRIHGNFQGIGAWTHRMAHQKPNTANIPRENNLDGTTKLLGGEMRALWRAPPGRLLVGVDAEGIQLRVFAHYIDDPEFTEALVKGKKDDKTDPHSLNKRILGSICKTRAAAKRFIYALLLGAGMWKLSQILETTEQQTKEALDRLLERYTGFAILKRKVIPKDAKRGFFIGLDGRKVRIPGDSLGERKHLAMSGYLQTGETVVMKRACLKWHDLLKQDNAILVNFVHDEWQTECPNDVSLALKIAQMQADSLREVGEELHLKCPLAGSYWNDDHKDYTIGTNWRITH